MRGILIKITLLLVILFSLLLTTASSGEIGVCISPGNLNFTLSPGSSVECSLSVLNTGTSIAGYLVSVDNEVYAGWFEIIPSNFKLQTSQERQVTVKLSVTSSIREDADCKIELLQTSDTNVLAGIRVPVHIELVTSNESFSGEPSGVSFPGAGIADDRNQGIEKKAEQSPFENEMDQAAEKGHGFYYIFTFYILAGACLAFRVVLFRKLLDK